MKVKKSPAAESSPHIQEKPVFHKTGFSWKRHLRKFFLKQPAARVQRETLSRLRFSFYFRRR
jgi:hypothetical protein